MRFLFIIVPQTREGRTQLIRVLVCMGLSPKLSHRSCLWRTPLNPSRKHFLLPGNEDSVGTWLVPGSSRARSNWCLPPSGGHFAFLPFPELTSQVSLSAEVKEAKNQSLKGELAGPKAGGRLARGEGRGQEAQVDPQAGLDLHGGWLLPAPSLCNPFKNEFSDPASWWNWHMWIKPMLLLTWFWCGSL